MKTLELNIETYETTNGKFVALLYRGNAITYRSPQRQTAEKAQDMARRAIWAMVDCSHKMEYDTDGQPYPVDCDAAGNEIFGYEATCPYCGYVDYTEDSD